MGRIGLNVKPLGDKQIYEKLCAAKFLNYLPTPAFLKYMYVTHFQFV